MADVDDIRRRLRLPPINEPKAEPVRKSAADATARSGKPGRSFLPTPVPRRKRSTSPSTRVVVKRAPTTAEELARTEAETRARQDRIEALRQVKLQAMRAKDAAVAEVEKRFARDVQRYVETTGDRALEDTVALAKAAKQLLRSGITVNVHETPLRINDNFEAEGGVERIEVDGLDFKVNDLREFE